MVQIQDLPVELLQHILSFFAFEKYYHPEQLYPNISAKAGNAAQNEEEDDDDDDDTDTFEGIETLGNICLVSRIFRDIAQPLLFRHLYDEDLGGETSSTFLFTKAIYERPDLAKYVQDITVTCLPFGEDGPPKPLTREEITFFKKEIKDLNLDDQEKTWLTAMEHRDPSVFVALATNKTPNVRCLHLPIGHVSIKPLTQLFSRNPSYLANLEYLFIEGSEDFAGYQIHFFQDLLSLPKLKSLTFEYGDLLGASVPSTWTTGKLAAEHVALHHCHLDASAIKKLMQACKSMKSFLYNNYSPNPQSQRTMPRAISPEFSAAQLTGAALLHKDTLENLHLEFALPRWAIQDIDEYNTSRVKIGSLREFSVLKYIVVQHAFLPKHPRFPASLETLRITDCNSSIREIAQKLAADCKKGLYPNLTDCKVLSTDITQPIKLPGQIIPEGQTPAQCFMALRDLFKGTQVDFHVVPYNLPDFDDYDEFDDDDDFDDEDGLAGFAAGGIPGFGGTGGQIPPHLMGLIMQDPDFAHLFQQGAHGAASEDSWETDDDGN